GGRHLFLSRNGERARLFGRRLGFRFLAALVRHRDGALLRHDLKVAPGLGFLLLDRARGVYIRALARPLGGGLALGDRLLGLDARFLLGTLGRLFLLGRLGSGRRDLVGDVALLIELRLAFGALDGQRLLARLEVLRRDRDLGLAHDLVALLLAG